MPSCGRRRENPFTAKRYNNCAPQGKVDFHACRVAYITMLFENGATLKEAQELARHITPHLTTNVYAKVRDERLAGLVEQVGAVLTPAAKHVHRMHDEITRTDDVSVVTGD